MVASAAKAPINAKISLTPVEGIRAISCVAILVGHVIYWVSLEAEDKAPLYKQYGAHPWMNFVLHIAEPAMEAFLVLTGYEPCKEAHVKQGGQFRCLASHQT